ncbi:DUF732 domain-containing protein [Mycobacterium sp. B14F4]|uniref:DUF732 domain-containing protein n=1 Tax=Mycobacterium sp. B14F4 TaxID=3153565 RepID=UPI00325EE736
MGTKRFFGAAAIVVALATAFATPVFAQTQEQIDQAFLTALRDRGVPVKDDAEALELAHATCDLLNDGGSLDGALQLIRSTEKKWSQEDAVNFGGLAVYAYCREHLPE